MRGRKGLTKQKIINALKRTRGDVMLAAEQLGVSVRTIYYYIERYPEVKAKWMFYKAALHRSIAEKSLTKLLESILQVLGGLTEERKRSF